VTWRLHIENQSTVRAAAKKFGISKSTVHKDITERLHHVNRALYNKVKKVLDLNKSERHLRGGLATREKYKNLKSKGDLKFTESETVPPVRHGFTFCIISLIHGQTKRYRG
jgi:putative DeoR family transcriptional regulator (stage III sporulation protein D)